MNRICLFLFFIINANNGFAQKGAPDTSSHKTIAAGPEYEKPSSFQKLWGRNWRTAWTTPVHVPFVWLDKIDGGLVPSKTNGGNETKGLKLKSPNGKEYALRSINKSRNDVVPKDFKHTFIEEIIQDGVSMSHPYGAFALPVMEDAAGIYHTEPRLVYLPRQPALDTLNEEFGNDLYMIEQRLSGDWSEADNLGNFKDFLGTDEVVAKLMEDHNNRADQRAFVKVRLFDMLLADWDRHEDQWKWGERKTGDKSVFIPVPRDRDQVFYRHNGFLIDRALVAIDNGYMQDFDYDSKNISALNFEERNIDRFFLNALSLADWIDAAKELQRSLTDEVIERSIRQLPPEIFAATGKELIDKLESRRGHLATYANEYYLVLAKEVEITGSKKRERFEIRTSDAGETSVKIFAINDGEANAEAIFSRTFKPEETRTIRVFGISGEDSYSIDGNSTATRIAIIGGPDKDSLTQTGNVGIHVYDDHRNSFQTSHAKFHSSRDSASHAFDYFDHNYNKKGFRPSLFYNHEDRFYIGLGYGFTTYKWRRSPFATQQSIDLHYSLCQNAFSVSYAAFFPNIIGKKWNVFLLGNYDAIRWTNFFGLGNETVLTAYDRDYFRMRTVEWLGNVGVNRQFGKSSVAVSGFFQAVKIISDTERYLTKVFLPLEQDAFEPNAYVGALLNYSYLSLNDSIVPTRGITFSANASYFSNTSQKEFFQKYFGRVQVYLPVGNKLSVAIRAAGSAILGKSGLLKGAEFYEHTVIGGPETLRGFRQDRFWGQTGFYNNNELRFITNLRTHLLNAKIGALVFFDDGRVWMPNENSNMLHTSYGTGIILAPFNKMSVTVTYGISKESRIFQASLNRLF